MIRQIIKIDRDLCNGCGVCVSACHEGAIGIVDEKAVLLRDDYCDGLGNCLPACPTGAITFEQRDTLAYDDAAVKANSIAKELPPLACGCPGSNAKSIARKTTAQPTVQNSQMQRESRLMQWPVQIKLVPVHAPYFENADLLIAADCTAYAHADFHQTYMHNRITLIGCPKLDEGEYSEKLTAILSSNNIRSVLVVRMEVPCCGGIVQSVTSALKNSGKMIPWQIVTIATDGQVV